MYINELWGHKYEGKTIRAASLHHDVAQKEKNSWRPLQQHLDNVAELYEKRFIANSPTPTLEFPTQYELGMATPSIIIEEKAKTRRSTLFSQNLKSIATTHEPQSAGYGKHFLNRHSSLPRINNIPSPLETRETMKHLRKSLSPTEMQHDEILLQGPDSPSIKSVVHKRTRISLPGSPRASEAVKNNLYASYLAFQATPRSQKLRRQSQLEIDTKTRNWRDTPRGASSQPQSPTEKANQNIEDLMKKCEDELNDRSRWMSAITNMQDLFLSPKYDRKSKKEILRKERMVEFCKDLFTSRDKNPKRS